jgi:O-antigen ligase
MAAGAAVVVLVGILINGSLAAYGLVLPVAAGSAIILIPGRPRLRAILAGGSFLLLLAGIGMMSQSAVGSAKIGQDATTSSQSRMVIWSTTIPAITDFMPFGSGLGSFPKVYPLYEKVEKLDPTVVVHAHNDYLELALELGIAGVLLILAFLAWWGAAVWQVWRSAEASPFVRAASIASAAMLAHSLVDFPLRETALSAFLAMCVALIAYRRGAPPPVDEDDLRPTRHYVFR